MNVLISGAAGFIGSHIFEALGKRGYNVIGIDDLSGGEESNINEAARAITESGADPMMVFANGSCGVRDSMLALMGKHQVDTLVHCAANAREIAAAWQPYNVTHNNADAYSAVLSAALQLGVKRVVLFSSIAVYGTGNGKVLPFRESYQKYPCDVYGLNKAMMEDMTKMLCEMHGVPYVILRPHNVFGVRQSLIDPYRNAVAIFMNKVMHGDPIEVYGDGEQTRAFSYIADALPAIIRAIEYCDDLNGQIFNVGGLEAVTVNELAHEVIFAMLGDRNSHPIQYLAERHEVRHAYSDHTLSEKTLGYTESMGWRNGVLEMAKWALSRGPQLVQNREPLEFTTDKTPQNWIDFAKKTDTMPKLPNFDDPQLLLPNEA